MQGKRILIGLLILFVTISVAGCGNPLEKLNRLHIKMQKGDVQNLFGSSFVAKASKVDAQGNVLDLWEMYDKKSKTTYQIFFLNDEVSQWGKKEELKSFPTLYSPPTKKKAESDIDEMMDLME